MVSRMSEGKVLFDGGIKSQPVDAVKGMIEFLTGEQLRELPAVVRLANGWQLTRSSKGDAYYMTSPKECSCPGFYYRHSCRHVKALREAVVKERIIDLHDTMPGEVRYWEEKERKKEQQPKPEEQLSPTQIFARNIVAAMES
jgi:hypothetical protein